MHNSYFKAEAGLGSRADEKEGTPRDEQRQAVSEKHGKKALRELDRYYEQIDATIDNQNKKTESRKAQD